MSLEEIEARLLATFPQLENVSPIRQLGDGWGSIAVEGNNEMVFRIAKNEIIQKQHRRQVRILPMLAARLERLEIPLPEYYIESSEAFPFGVMGYRKIKGFICNPNQMPKEKLANLVLEMAAFLKKFHDIPITNEFADFGLPKREYSYESLEKTWSITSGWLRANLTKTEYVIAEKWWKEAMIFFESHPQENVFVHGDPWYENIVLDENFHIKGILDFDNVSIGDHAIDFVVQQYISTAFMNDVIRAYQNLGGKLGVDFAQRVAFLSGIKRLEDVRYGLETAYVYPESLENIKKTIVNNSFEGNRFMS